MIEGKYACWQNTVDLANIVIKRPRSNLVVSKRTVEPCLLFYFTIPIFFAPATVSLLLVFLYLFLLLSPLSIMSQTAHPTPDLAKMFATFFVFTGSRAVLYLKVSLFSLPSISLLICHSRV